ncbi:MAG: hypothetical protein VYA35_10685 [Pseudomonadota bacterium]|nr:hypothetical protein [Pseudomonadota bacterium]|tara:strand:- start:27348 stop:27824 length:477 start_codon:yes stop_codon:yes gene_type:complete
MQVEVTQIEALEDRAQYAERQLRHCKQWYAERIERLTAYAKENGIWPDVACIIANGSLSDGTRYDPPTYAQQLNTAIHRAEAAEDRASKLQGTVDTLEAQIAELRSALEKADAAIAEYYRYWTGGETRGSYDGKPERANLWKAGHASRAALQHKKPKP